jgi:hypothetical protein
MARCNLGYGKTALFWNDLWHDSCLSHKMSHLITFIMKNDITVNEAISTKFLEDLFHLPLSVQDFEEFEELQLICGNTRQLIQNGEKDSWTYIWGSNVFLTKKAYKVMVEHQPTIPHFSWIWRTSCQARHKVFLWLLLLDRLNTSERACSPHVWFW